MRRKVRVQIHGDAIFVLYADRKKYQPKSAAQFHRSVKTPEQVVEWIRQKGYELI